MTCSKVAVGAAVALGALLLAACRSNVKGLAKTDGPAPPPQTERQDASSPTGPTVADATAPPPVTDVGSQADVASLPVDMVARPPDMSAPVDTAVAATDAAGPAPTWLGPVVRAKEIEADVIVAQIIYAKEIETEEAKVDALTESKDEKRWEMERAETKIAVQSLLAEVIYVEKIKCRRVEARALYAEKVKIQRR
jgi:hypothetical protein